MWQGTKRVVGIFWGKSISAKFHYMVLFNLLALVAGVSLVWLACAWYAPAEQFSLIFWSVCLPVVVLSLSYFGKYGIFDIPVGSVGVCLILNQPIKDPIFPAGLIWTLPPPFMDILALDTRLRITKLGFAENTEPKGWKVMCKDNEVVVHASIPWKIVDAYEVAVMTTKVIHDGIEEVAKKELREEATKYNADEFVAMKEALSDQLKTEAEKISRTWGIQIENGVMVTKMTLPEDILKARRQVAIEKAGKKALKTEREALTKEAERVKTKLDIDGDTAAQIVTTLMGKPFRRERVYHLKGGIKGFENLRTLITNASGLAGQKPRQNRPNRGGGRRGTGNPAGGAGTPAGGAPSAP